MKRALLLPILAIACNGGVDGTPGDGDPGAGDPEAQGDHAAAGDSMPGDTGGGDTDGGDPGAGDPGAGDPGACSLAGVDGLCADVTSCAEASFLGLCAGPPSTQCCLSGTACSVSGAPGLCIDTTACPAGWASTAGLCPGSAAIQCCTEIGAACDEAASPTPNEGLTEASWEPSCPDGMVRVDAFCIDRYEASLLEIDAGGDVVGSWSPYRNPGASTVRAVSLAGAVPQGYISGGQAAGACAEAGKRLCSDAEWLRACQGSTGTTYPYGDVRQNGLCNDSRALHPAVEYFGTSDAWIWSELGNRCINQIPDALHITGRHVGCVTADGAFDMMGNLHEWTADLAGTFRGGYYADTSVNGEGCLYVTTAHNSSHWDYSTGFRCCADPL